MMAGGAAISRICMQCHPEVAPVGSASFSRRALLRAGCGLLAGAVAACGQYEGASTASDQATGARQRYPTTLVDGVPVAGCCLVNSAAGTSLSHRALNPTANPRPQSTGNPDLDVALGVALNEMSDIFQVSPGFIFWDDADSDNAFALPQTEMAGTSGTVLIGRAMLRRELTRSTDGDMAILAICAHEFGHIVQYSYAAQARLLNGETTVRRVELHADFLSGFYLGRRPFDYRDGQLLGIVAAFSALGDNNLTDPQHHGTPDERLGALDAGFRMGRASGRGVSDAVGAGFFYLGV